MLTKVGFADMALLSPFPALRIFVHLFLHLRAYSFIYPVSSVTDSLTYQTLNKHPLCAGHRVKNYEIH